MLNHQHRNVASYHGARKQEILILVTQRYRLSNLHHGSRVQWGPTVQQPARAHPCRSPDHPQTKV